jgi:hypothetical protein
VQKGKVAAGQGLGRFGRIAGRVLFNDDGLVKA